MKKLNKKKGDKEVRSERAVKTVINKFETKKDDSFFGKKKEKRHTRESIRKK